MSKELVYIFTQLENSTGERGFRNTIKAILDRHEKLEAEILYSTREYLSENSNYSIRMFLGTCPWYEDLANYVTTKLIEERRLRGESLIKVGHEASSTMKRFKVDMEKIVNNGMNWEDLG